ncbi:TMEM230 [Bugula neritina]|uniref:Transmembrane protein 230 n=1 Tax=Bugula neritina TaxID=10212 RepID=A0A7J7JNR3_BUGNE|nr:TMEM230 [Bugula neritina]
MSPCSKEKVPCKSILLAIALFTVGTVLLVVGSLLVTGTIIPAEYADRTIPVLGLGVIAFLPGSYHTYLA